MCHSGRTAPFEGIYPPFVLYFLALYHYLTRVGSKSLQAFRPLLEVDETYLAEMNYRFANLPRWAGWLSIAIGLISLPQYFSSGQAFGDRDPNTALPYIVAVAAGGFFGSTIFALIIRSIRQLRMVHRLQAQAAKINLLDLEPAHAFSGLTARTGIGIILLLVLGFIRDSSSVNGTYLFGAYLLLGVPAIVVFVVPVLGMRDCLVEEKKRKLHETSELLQSTIDKMEARVHTDDYSDLQGMETAIRALIRKREMLEKISTWPWNPGTIRGFASTLLLPIVLWLVTRFLGRFV